MMDFYELSILQQEWEEARLKLKELKEKLEEIEKLRKQEREEWEKNLAVKIIPVLNSLYRARNMFSGKEAEGIDLVIETLREFLKSYNIEVPELIGKSFDPEKLEAVEKAGDGNKVIKVIEPLIVWKKEVIKTGKVVVG